MSINRGNVTLDGLGFADFYRGVNFGAGVIENVTLANLTLSDNIVGINVASTDVILNGLTVQGGEIKDGYHGINQARAAANGSVFNNLVVDGVSFSNLNEKGIYIEGMNGGSFTGLTMDNVGAWGRNPAFGGEGTDVLTFSSASAGIIADMVSGGTGGDAAGDVYSGFERIVGSRFADTIRDGGTSSRISGGNGDDVIDGRGGADSLYGGAGNDTLIGGAGRDRMEGEAGDDVFVFSALSESTVASPDIIFGFSGDDRVDLSAIDADGNAGNGDTAFTFIGDAAFTALGQVRAVNTSGTTWRVELNGTGTTAADAVIMLTSGPATSSADWFIL